MKKRQPITHNHRTTQQEARHLRPACTWKFITSAILSFPKVTASVVAALAVSGHAASSPRPRAVGLNASVFVYVTSPSDISAPVRLSSPGELLNSNTLCNAVCASLEKAALFSAVMASPPVSTDSSADFILDVAFGPVAYDNVAVTLPSRWRLLTQTGRQVIVAQSVGAHGGPVGVAWTAKSAYKTKVRKAVTDAISIGIASLSTNIDARTTAGESLELLLCVPVTPETQRAMLENVETNSSPSALQMSIRKPVTPELTKAAQARLPSVVQTSTNLAELIALCEKTSALSADLKTFARDRAITLINAWPTGAGDAPIRWLLSVGSNIRLEQSDLGAVAMHTAQKLIVRNYEAISLEDYRRAFSAPDGRLLRLWVIRGMIKGNTFIAEESRLSPTGGGQAAFTYKINEASSADGITQLKCSTESLRYELNENENTGIVREVVWRSSGTGNPAVETEVILINDKRYRKTRAGVPK